MTEPIAALLVSEEGATLLQEGTAALVKRRGIEPDIRAGALALLEGRERARKKHLPDADQLFLTPEMLAQASSPGIAAWHAAQLKPFGSVVDYCCGAGLDANGPF